MDARQLRNHLFRLAFVSFIYICLLYATVTSFAFGAPGLSFFTQIAWLNMLFITCAGIGFFASAITEEKEEDTIGLLQMAGLNHLGILLGKSTSRMIQVVLLLVVQFPFMLLAVTLGGVTTKQIVAAYVDMTAYTVLIANIGLLCSVIFRRGGFATAVTTLIVVFYIIAPHYATMQKASLIGFGWNPSQGWTGFVMDALTLLEKSSAFDEMSAVMQTGFDKPIMNRQVVSNCVVGAICFGLSWLLFGPCVNRVDNRGDGRGVLTRPVGRFRILSPGRSWSNPFIWKDFQFICGGGTILIVKSILYIAVGVGITLIAMTPQNWFGWTNREIEPLYCQIMLGAFVIEACIFASRIFHDEIRLHTMSALLMLPRSIPYIGYSKLIGCLMGMVPAAICLTMAVAFLPRTSVTKVLTSAVDPRLWAGIMMLLVFLHLVSLLSLFVKWGALPAAAFLMGPISVCCPALNMFILIGNNNSAITSVWGELPATITIWILTGLVCFVFQMMIAARLQELGTR